MATSFNINVDKIVFTSPNMPSPSPAGTRSHVIPDEMDLGTWYEQGTTMTRAALQQNIYDTSYCQGLDRPVFGYSGIVASGTQYLDSNDLNYIYVDTEDTWLTTTPFNLYIDDNSWFNVIDINEYVPANDPPPSDDFVATAFTTSGTLTTSRNVIINGCVCDYNNLTYIFNTDQLYSFSNSTETYTLITTCPYDIDYPVAMVGYSDNLYIHYLDDTTIKTAIYDISGDSWSAGDTKQTHKTAADITEIGNYEIDGTIYVALKYAENSVPASIYLYLYNPSSDDWDEQFVDTCGKYNLNINDAMIECDGTYLYIMERYSKLLHKIRLSDKHDTQIIINNETDSNSSMILMGSYLYIYSQRNNTFEKLDPSTTTSTDLTAPTIQTVDTEDVENTTLSDDGTDIYLSFNKGIQWINSTYLYKYNISGDSWTATDVPQAGSISFNGHLCTASGVIYGVDQEYLFKYNSTDQSWATLTELPRDDAEDSIICSDGNYIYTIINQCGYFWKYDIANDQWTMLQSVSLPAPTAYEGTKPGNMFIDNNKIYMGLYYNYATSTRDTFYYTYDINDDTWTTAVAPKTSSNRSFFMYPYMDSGDLMLAGCVTYPNYTYTTYRRTDEANNTWSTEDTININNIASDKYLCMYGQLKVGNIIYLSFSLADNNAFNCSDPTCRAIDISGDTSSYWLPNPITEMYMAAIDTSYIYYIDINTNMFYKYNISSTATTTESIPRQSYVNYFVYTYSSTTYLLGKQEIEYNPNLYQYSFIIYYKDGSSWSVYDTYTETSTSQDTLYINAIQEYYGLGSMVYMAAFEKSSNTKFVAEHKKYDIPNKTLTDFVVDPLVTSITSTDSDTLALAKGNSIIMYETSDGSTTDFIDGIAGNRSEAYLYVYKYDGKVRALGGQYYDPESGAKFLTYEYNTTWSGIVSQTIPSTLYNTLDYSHIGDYVYMINTDAHLKYDKTDDSISYVSNAPTNTSMCCSAASGINMFSDHYDCLSYYYDGTTFSWLPGDITRTYEASNLTTHSGTLYFVKNGVTNELSKLDIDSNTTTTTTLSKIFGTTPFLIFIEDTLHMLLPDSDELIKIEGTTITTLKNSLSLNEYCSGCYDGTYLYYTGGHYSYNFSRINMTTYNVETLKNLPELQTTHGSIGYYNNKILYITSNSLYEYDISSNTWTFIRKLREIINNRGLIIGSTYLYYAGSDNINSISLTNMNLKSSYYSPIPRTYHGCIAKQDSVFYLHYNESEVKYSCSLYHSDDDFTLLDLLTVTHLPPTAVPYNLTVLDTTEKNVTFKWEISSGSNITHYRVYRREYNEQTHTYVGKTTSLSYVDILADRGKHYFYTVRACNEWGGTTTTSNELEIKVDGSEYKYMFIVDTWNNRKKDPTKLQLSEAFRWGNSNIDFNDCVVISITFGEAYECYITAWDDDTHSTTDNVLLQNNCYRISACAFASLSDTQLEEPDDRAMRCRPKYNVVLKGNNNIYGKFNINYEPESSRYGGYIIFKPLLLNIPISIMTKGKYEFVTSFHYKYT